MKDCGVKVSKSCSSLAVSNLSSSPVSNGFNASLQDSYIIKVSLEPKNCDIEGVNMYKSIMLSNSDRTRTVITNAMIKHGIDGDPDDYSLVQLIPGGEITFPESANVYYAVNPAHELKFVLRLKYKLGTCVEKKTTIL
ncbi:Ral guanine nucleotide dissociation stimulator-like 1, partial [Stegodyphus mimosarum]